nr:MAG TPA: hypothetical protein [Bacteriophage sp.]
MRINITPSEIYNMLFHDFNNIYKTLADIIEKANKKNG